MCIRDRLNSLVSEGNVNNDQDQDFQRQLALVQEEKAEDHKRRSQRACQHRLFVQLLVVLLLLCFVLGVLPQHYFPMDVSTEIFPTRAFQMGVSGVHAGVWGVLTEKFHSSKLMGLYGAARDVPPLFLIHGSNKSENQKEKTNSTLNSQLSTTPTTQHPKGIAARITPHSITPKSTRHTRRDGARRAK